MWPLAAEMSSLACPRPLRPAEADLASEAGQCNSDCTDSDIEGGLGGGGGDDAVAGVEVDLALLWEPWMSFPADERKLWEVARPTHVRKEAARVRSLRLPNAAVTRLLRLHPDLPSRPQPPPEVSELINCATVLLLQATGRALGKLNSGRRVQFDQVRELCENGAKELSFLRPMAFALDDSARKATPLGALPMPFAKAGQGQGQMPTLMQQLQTPAAALPPQAAQPPQAPALPAAESPSAPARGAKRLATEKLGNGGSKGKRAKASAPGRKSKPAQCAAPASGGTTLASFFRRVEGGG